MARMGGRGALTVGVCGGVRCDRGLLRPRGHRRRESSGAAPRVRRDGMHWCARDGIILVVVRVSVESGSADEDTPSGI